MKKQTKCFTFERCIAITFVQRKTDGIGMSEKRPSSQGGTLNANQNFRSTGKNTKQETQWHRDILCLPI